MLPYAVSGLVLPGHLHPPAARGSGVRNRTEHEHKDEHKDKDVHQEKEEEQEEEQEKQEEEQRARSGRTGC